MSDGASSDRLLSTSHPLPSPSVAGNTRAEKLREAPPARARATAIAALLSNGAPPTRGTHSISPLAPDAVRRPPADLNGPPRYLRSRGLTPSPSSRPRLHASQNPSSGRGRRRGSSRSTSGKATGGTVGTSSDHHHHRHRRHSTTESPSVQKEAEVEIEKAATSTETPAASLSLPHTNPTMGDLQQRRQRCRGSITAPLVLPEEPVEPPLVCAVPLRTTSATAAATVKRTGDISLNVHIPPPRSRSPASRRPSMLCSTADSESGVDSLHVPRLSAIASEGRGGAGDPAGKPPMPASMAASSGFDDNAMNTSNLHSGSNGGSAWVRHPTPLPSSGAQRHDLQSHSTSRVKSTALTSPRKIDKGGGVSGCRFAIPQQQPLPAVSAANAVSPVALNDAEASMNDAAPPSSLLSSSRSPWPMLQSSVVRPSVGDTEPSTHAPTAIGVAVFRDSVGQLPDHDTLERYGQICQSWCCGGHDAPPAELLHWNDHGGADDSAATQGSLASLIGAFIQVRVASAAQLCDVTVADIKNEVQFCTGTSAAALELVYDAMWLHDSLPLHLLLDASGDPDGRRDTAAPQLIFLCFSMKNAILGLTSSQSGNAASLTPSRSRRTSLVGLTSPSRPAKAEGGTTPTPPPPALSAAATVAVTTATTTTANTTARAITAGAMLVEEGKLKDAVPQSRPGAVRFTLSTPLDWAGGGGGGGCNSSANSWSKANPVISQHLARLRLRYSISPAQDEEGKTFRRPAQQQKHYSPSSLISGDASGLSVSGSGHATHSTAFPLSDALVAALPAPPVRPSLRAVQERHEQLSSPVSLLQHPLQQQFRSSGDGGAAAAANKSYASLGPLAPRRKLDDALLSCHTRGGEETETEDGGVDESWVENLY